MRNLSNFLEYMTRLPLIGSLLHHQPLSHDEWDAKPFSPLSWEMGMKQYGKKISSAPAAPTESNGGFTLIELVITVAIVGLLATLALPVAELGVQRFKEQELRDALREIRIALDAYKRSVGEGRVENAIGKSGYPPSLKVLVEGVVDASLPGGKSRIYFLRRIPRDPMFSDPATPDEETWGKRSYASSHDAPEEGEDVFDVYSLSKGVGLNGIEYRNW